MVSLNQQYSGLWLFLQRDETGKILDHPLLWPISWQYNHKIFVEPSSIWLSIRQKGPKKVSGG